MSSTSDMMQSQLATKIERLKELYDKDDKEKNINCKIHVEISNLLLWLATNNPEVICQETAHDLSYFIIKRLYFTDSLVKMDEPIPKDALVTLLNSEMCAELKSFAGYIDPIVLDNFNQAEGISTFRLALGKHIDVKLLIKKLNERRVKCVLSDDIFSDENIIIHIKCRELDPKDLASLPDVCYPELYISDVSDQDTAWVIQVAAALCPKIDPRIINLICPEESCLQISSLHLIHSTVTANGAEAIAKGLFDANIEVGSFGIDSTNIDEDTEIQGYEDTVDWLEKISDKYNIEEVTWTDVNELTKITEWMADDDDSFEYKYSNFG